MSVGAVRMGEMAVSAAADDELIAIGLGSCLGVALIDRTARIGGLAHVVLPESGGTPGPAAKFADTAIPELVARLEQAGAQRSALEAVLVGGARMFALGGGLDIGARNDSAVREALGHAGVRVRAAATGGTHGRTLRMLIGPGVVSAQEAGGAVVTLLGGPESAATSEAVPTGPKFSFKAAGARG